MKFYKKLLPFLCIVFSCFSQTENSLSFSEQDLGKIEAIKDDCSDFNGFLQLFFPELPRLDFNTALEKSYADIARFFGIDNFDPFNLQDIEKLQKVVKQKIDQSIEKLKTQEDFLKFVKNSSILMALNIRQKMELEEKLVIGHGGWIIVSKLISRFSFPEILKLFESSLESSNIPENIKSELFALDNISKNKEISGRDKLEIFIKKLSVELADKTLAFFLQKENAFVKLFADQLEKMTVEAKCEISNKIESLKRQVDCLEKEIKTCTNYNCTCLCQHSKQLKDAVEQLTLVEGQAEKLAVFSGDSSAMLIYTLGKFFLLESAERIRFYLDGKGLPTLTSQDTLASV